MLPPAGFPIWDHLDDASRRRVLPLLPRGQAPVMAQGAAVRAWDCEPRHEIDHIMRQVPVGKSREETYVRTRPLAAEDIRSGR